MQRMTKQREAVLEQLSRQDQFRSAQEVHSALAEAGKKVSLATVYRNLQVLADSRQVDVVRGVDGEARYRLCQKEAHHHHLICRSCGRVEEFTPQSLENGLVRLAADYGYADISHSLEIFGTCPKCAAKR